MCEKTLRRLLPWLLPCLLMAGVIAVFGICYTTNDDATIANLAAGAYGPDRVHLVYVNVLVGALLRPLYWLCAGVNWYAWFLLALAFFACVALCRLSVQWLGPFAGSCLFAAVALPFSLEMLQSLHYNKITALCVTAGLAWLAARLGEPLAKSWPGILLVFFGALLRWEMLLVCVALGAAVLPARFAALRGPARKRAARAALLLLAMILAARAVNFAAYRLDGGWRAFTAYNAARTEFSDYKAQRLDGENPFADQGISDNDLAVLHSWDYYDGTVFPAARLQALAAQVPAKGLRQALGDTLRTLLRLFHDASYRYVYAAVLAAALLFSKRRLPVVCVWAVLAAEVFYLCWRDRFPRYVEAPLLFSCTVCCLVSLAGGGCPEKAARPACKRACAVAGLALAVLVSAPGFSAAYRVQKGFYPWGTPAADAYDALSADKQNLYLLTSEDITAAEGRDVWHPRPEDFFSNIVFYGGWLSHAPHREQVLAAYGLQDPVTDAVDAPHVFLSAQDAGMVERYAAEHTGLPVRAVEAAPGTAAPLQLTTSP